MIKIEDMSETERESWIVLLADGAVLIWFLQKMTTSWSLVPNNIGMKAFGEVVIGLIIVTVILHAVISAVFDIRSREALDDDGDYEKDERDYAVERKGAHWGYRIMQYGVGAVIITMLIQAGAGADYQGPISIQTPVEIIFYLLVISYAADLLKQIVMIHGFRS